MIGAHPDTRLPIQVVQHPFGRFLQLGEWTGEKPFPILLPLRFLKQVDPESIGLETAVALFNLPRRLGIHPADGLEVSAGVGMFGAYVQHGSRRKTFREHFDVLTITIEEAVAYLKIRGTP
jgi:DNA topoisomerase I